MCIATDTYLHLLSAAVATMDDRFGQGSGPILLAGVRCLGTETRLADCPEDTNTKFCFHFDDSGVRCQLQTGI